MATRTSILTTMARPSWMVKLEFPNYVTNVNNSGNTACTYGAATNDMLTTTVVAGGGTLGIRSQLLLRRQRRWDSFGFQRWMHAPAILAAAQFADY